MIFVDEEKMITQGTLETIVAELSEVTRDLFQKIEKELGREAAAAIIQECVEVAMIPEEDFERVMTEKEEKVKRELLEKCIKEKSQ